MTTTACLGRERELAWVTSRLEATGAHGTAMVTITGPPGIGKSRLLDELREQCHIAGFPVLEGWCVRHAAYAPFVPIAAQALAWLRNRDEQDLLSPTDLDALAPLVAARTSKLRDTDGSDEGDEEAAIRFTEAVGRLLAAVGRLRPVLVLLRGWSRADDATRALVRALLDAAGPVGEPTPGAPAALFVVGIRTVGLSAPIEHPRVERLELEGLSLDGIRRLLATESVLARLHALTSGNPAAILAMLERLPPPRESEVTARLDELGELPRRVLAILSLADRPLPTGVIAAALGVEPQTINRTIPTLIAASTAWRTLDPTVGDVVLGLARHDDGEAAIARIDADELPTLRQALGAALDAWGRASPEEVVRHRLAGNRPAEASAEAVSVARSLLRRHAPASALALAHLASPYATPSIARELARVAAAAAPSIAAYTEARAVVAAAEQAAPDDPELPWLDASLALGAGDWEGAEAALDRADARTHNDAAQRAANVALRAELSYVRGKLDETERLAREAIALSRDDDPVATRARNTMTKVFLARRDLDAGWEWSREGLERARARGSATEVLRGLINLGVVAIWRGDLVEAARQLGEARLVAENAGSMMLRGVLRENEAVVAHLQGRYGDALQRYQEALGILTRVGNRRFLARVAHNLGELYAHVGEIARARRLCEYAAQVARGFTGPIAAENLMLRARVELADARTEAARASLMQALGTFTAVGDTLQQAEARILLARVALLDGDLARAEQELSLVSDEGVTASVRVERALCQVELARSRGEDAFPYARRALELAEAVPDRDLRYRAHVAVGIALLDRNDPTAARRQAAFAESLRQEILARVPESLRVSYGAQLARDGGALLAARLEGTGSLLQSEQPRPTTVTVRAAEYGLIGESAAMRELRRRIARVAPQDVTVLLRGESGTGKERVAEALHQGSHRKNAPLVKVNCAALAEGVLLSELFGHERGAFTGADRRRRGRFELADGGTIFLDEIGDVTPATQAALLRVLQERTFERVGGNETLKVDVRIIAATNRDLAQMVRDRTFREDLYFRLSSLTIQLPPLRERLEDLPLLAAWFIERDAGNGPPKRLTAAALRRLAEHPWPGNVRELENVLRASVLFADGNEITPDDLQGLPDLPRSTASLPPVALSSPTPTAPNRDEVDAVYERIRHGGVSLFDMRREVERGCIARALEESGGNITRAAALLGMKRPRLSQLVREYGLARGTEPADTPEP
jgi:DNA-binding NtrC family response regulator